MTSLLLLFSFAGKYRTVLRQIFLFPTFPDTAISNSIEQVYPTSGMQTTTALQLIGNQAAQAKGTQEAPFAQVAYMC